MYARGSVHSDTALATPAPAPLSMSSTAVRSSYRLRSASFPMASSITSSLSIMSFAVIGVAAVGWFASLRIPSAPPMTTLKIDFNIFRASWRLISATMHIRRLYLAIIAISVFWTIAMIAR